MSDELGTCDKKQYEHAGQHVQIFEVGQSMPPFPCENWKPVTARENWHKSGCLCDDCSRWRDAHQPKIKGAQPPLKFRYIASGPDGLRDVYEVNPTDVVGITQAALDQLCSDNAMLKAEVRRLLTLIESVVK